MTLLLILQLFATFFVIGMFTFGGGYAMLSLIQGQVVVSHEWISQSTFTDIVAISQMTPGPIGINCATYVGYDILMKATGSHFLGVLGSFTATSAIVLPSFIIVLALVKFYVKFHGNTIFESVMSWIRPSVVGLIGAAAIILMFNASWAGMPMFSRLDMSIVSENFPDWKSWALFGAAMVASMFFKVGPIPIIVAGGVLGFLIYLRGGRRSIYFFQDDTFIVVRNRLFISEIIKIRVADTATLILFNLLIHIKLRGTPPLSTLPAT